MPIERSPSKIQFYCSSSSPDLSEDKNITMRPQKRKQGDDIEFLMQKFESMFSNWTSTQDEKYATLLETMNTIKDQNTHISSSLEFLSHQYDSLKDKYDNLLQGKKVDKIYIENLENKIEILERNNHASCIEIRNIPSIKR
ncbi:unnamed protein product [Parnassius apollo]|uniref:(apollo) hypothetical protein n=1 Tax=Parnassius apollo TaxID=110799 RepID=A0A8S3W0R5_PARAO|nr:unnamed protein product [Parnassius apollo]